jgi:hypothetical protein
MQMDENGYGSRPFKTWNTILYFGRMKIHLKLQAILTVNSGAPVSARASDAGLWSSKIAMESQQSLTSVKSN